jgi:hypothetical protein
MAATLAEGQVYDLTVLNIIAAVETFTGQQDASKTFFAHNILLANDLADHFPVQISDLNSSFTLFEIGDTVQVKIGKWIRDKYAAKFCKIVKKRDRSGAAVPVIPYNPLVGGSAAAVALQQAVEFQKFNSEIDVLQVADTYFEWLKSKI